MEALVACYMNVALGSICMKTSRMDASERGVEKVAPKLIKFTKQNRLTAYKLCDSSGWWPAGKYWL